MSQVLVADRLVVILHASTFYPREPASFRVILVFVHRPELEEFRYPQISYQESVEHRDAVKVMGFPDPDHLSGTLVIL